MNVFSFTGNLGKDCQTRFTPGGEAVAPYLLKGALVGVSGELTNREYTDKDGAKRYSLDVRVNDLTLLGGKPEPREHSERPTGAEG